MNRGARVRVNLALNEEVPTGGMSFRAEERRCPLGRERDLAGLRALLERHSW